MTSPSRRAAPNRIDGRRSLSPAGLAVAGAQEGPNAVAVALARRCSARRRSPGLRIARRSRLSSAVVGRSTFSADEIETLCLCLAELRRAERDRQKAIRASMRRMGFYITDFSTDSQGFTVSDLNELVRRGVIQVTS